MAKLTSLGTVVTKGGVTIANVVSADITESEGEIYGQKQFDGNLTLILDSATTPIRQGEIFDLVVTAGSATWAVSVDDAEVINTSIAIKRGSAVLQTIEIVGRKTASIA